MLYAIYVPESAGETVRTRDGSYYPVRDGVALVAAHHAAELQERYPVPLFSAADAAPQDVEEAVSDPAPADEPSEPAQIEPEPEAPHDGDEPNVE